jgi:hypothetical protein
MFRYFVEGYPYLIEPVFEDQKGGAMELIGFDLFTVDGEYRGRVPKDQLDPHVRKVVSFEHSRSENFFSILHEKFHKEKKKATDS